MFDRFRQALPKPLGSEARFERAGNRFRLAIPLPAGLELREPYFYPLTDGALSYAAAQTFSRAGDTLIVETDAPSNGGSLDAVEGVLKLGDGNGLSLRAVPGTVPAAGTALAPEAAQPAPGASAVLAALLGAVLGGLLLNIMPCVFPILSLKALSLAKAGGDEGAAKREALAYTAGAVLICLGLGAALLGLRAGGAAAGWAFQLQDPRVILSLLLLITAVALNLAGLFELPAVTGGRPPCRTARAQRRLLDRRARRVRGDALHRSLHGRRARAPPWCCRRRSRSPSSPAWAWVSPCRSCCSASCPRSGAACRSRARGWSGSGG